MGTDGDWRRSVCCSTVQSASRQLLMVPRVLLLPPPCAETYLRTIVPISALYAGTLWLGNAAYIYLSVSFIQMLKVGGGCPGTGCFRALSTVSRWGS